MSSEEVVYNKRVRLTVVFDTPLCDSYIYDLVSHGCEPSINVLEQRI